MKISDLIKIASKNMKGKWMVLPVIGFAVSVFCLCFAGTVLTNVGQEKARPYELMLSSESADGLSASVLVDISKLPDVEAVTPLLQVSARVKTGEYSAQLTLTGIDPAYLKDAFSVGGIFPDKGVMPYIVLNNAACKQFSDKNTETDTSNNTGADTSSKSKIGSDAGSGSKSGISSDTNTSTKMGNSANTGASNNVNHGSVINSAGNGSKSNTSVDTNGNTGTDTSTNVNSGSGTSNSTNNSSNVNTNTGTDNVDNVDMPKIDWLNAGVSLQSVVDGRWIISKVCGILSGNGKDQEPTAYISLSAAKDLLQKSGQNTDYTRTNIRIKNIGCAANVSQAISALGLTVTNSDTELQTKWDMELGEMTYLIVLGGFCLLCTAVLMSAWRKISIVEQKEAWQMLRWIGLKQKDIDKLFIIQTMLISLIGLVIGFIVSISLPSFLPPKLKGTSSYTLSIPFVVAVASSVICIIIGVITACVSKKHQPQL